MRRPFLLVGTVLMSVACATAIRLAPVTPGSAADPDSVEPPPPTISQTLRPQGSPHDATAASVADDDSGPGQTAHTGHTEEKTMPIATVYTCPMHPEVRSDVPGTCPKCGMKLVPMKPTPDPGSPR